MAKVTLYHNPRCSKSRQALALLEEQGIQPTVVLYLEQAPSTEELTNLVKLLKIKPIELVRRKEALYRELKLDKLELSDQALLTTLSKHPILIERPIVVANKKAVIARPPERLLEVI